MMLDDRFWSKVAIRSDTECWNWTANKNNKGYGLFRPGGMEPKKLAHRLSYENQNGPIPKGGLILHSCDNPSCVNPSHLRVGTHKENVADMDDRGRRVSPHLLGEDNVNSKLSERDVISLRLDYLSGVDLDALCKRYGCSSNSLNDYTSGRSWKHILGRNGCPTLEELKRENVRRRNSGAKLTKSDVTRIKSRLAGGALLDELASEFGVHKATISDIKTGKTWKNVS